MAAACDRKYELMDEMAAALSRLHELLLAERQAGNQRDQAGMELLETEIAATLEQKSGILERLRAHAGAHGC